MIGNLILKRSVSAIYTTVGAAAPVWDSQATGYFASDLLPVSGASAITLTLPPAALTLTTLGGGNGQCLTFMNLAAQSLVIAAASTDTILGASTTIAQNASVTYVADSANNRWFRMSV